ncbi:restriction endonuclease subunit S [Paenibacillus chondroitinus]|uniref:Restriction endonuclease subunit S n=1 Tax=Paenibacillus chondroitinus TaxID=59842 RepID=A0ABU6D626_9BACL|nr:MULTISPECIES: restriction endonuclease subunit S [Paenibacillus]MCY9658163.1 restriction endonuclease subunit S [Paenibacillus anseongense]MEB4793174.1 restriction endonuclease subunit S [Paenibacillus chondroitinus]
MAKGKKQSISAEKLLEQALVPEYEQQYNVPENWLWVTGRTAFGNMESTKPSGDFFKYIDIDAIDNKNQRVLEPKIIAVEEAPSRASRKVNEGDTLFSLVRPYLRNIAYIDSFHSDCIASTGFYVCHPNKMYNPRYIYYLMTSEYVVNGLNAYMKGDNSPSIRKDDIENFAYPLPPIAEQQRIVDRIESLFVKLDQAKERIQSALDSFETRKSAILHQAFTGALTAKWRQGLGLGMDSWEKKKLRDLANFRAGYAFDSNSFTPKGYQVVRMGNLYNGKLDLDRNPVFVNPDILDDSVFKKSLIKTGDILLTLTGTKYKRDYGYAVMINEDKMLLLNQRIVALTPNQTDPNFLLYYLRSDLFRNVFFSNETGGVNQGNVSSKFVESIEIPYPTPLEQQKIVSILVEVLGKENKVKELIDVIDQIDLMKKAILARAFRGELGTNDPIEEVRLELILESVGKENKSKITTKNPSFTQKQIDTDLVQLLIKANRRLRPEEFWEKSGISDPLRFYRELKICIEHGFVNELFEQEVTFLEVTSEGKQYMDRKV